MEITSQLTAEEKRAIIRDNGGDKEHLLAILYELQNASGYNYIDEETAALVAEEVGMNPTRVYDIITFYAMLKTEPKARYVLKVCNSTPCHFSRSEEIAQILKEELLPAMGCTEPIALAYGAALARKVLGELPDRVVIGASGSIIKNVKSVIVPNTDHLKGIPAAAAAGIIAGRPEKELEVRARIEYMKGKNARGDDDFDLVVFDLYDVIIDFLEKKHFLEKCYDFEKKNGMERITKAVTNAMKINDNDSLIVQYIKEHTPENAIVFLTGIGKCYPILRSHKVLNNLHQAFVRCPVVMFFPGTYNDQELILFNEIKDDNYYRAFRLVK